MRLLNVDSRRLEEYIGDDAAPSYAILSHTWGGDEVTFQDLSNPEHRSKRGYEKIEGCCQQAVKDGHQYVWIDTCCIDKSSSAELSEAINSMYKWYKESKVCYVYLVDVSPGDSIHELDSEFRRSRWFTRGWTLQELLAPSYLEFYDKCWRPIGFSTRPTRPCGLVPRRPTSWAADATSSVASTLLEEVAIIPSITSTLLEDITGIPSDVFISGDVAKYCAAAVLAWAAHRETTRIEDSAYSLLGLLDLNMPLLYGEGSRAFQRLQEEILASRHDESILAAGYGCLGHRPLHDRPIFARSMSEFQHCGNFRMTRRGSLIDPLGDPSVHSSMTNIGLLIELPLIRMRHGLHLAVLRYGAPFRSHLVLVVPLIPTYNRTSNHFTRAPGSTPFFVRYTGDAKPRRNDSIIRKVLGKQEAAYRLRIYLQDLPDFLPFNGFQPLSGCSYRMITISYDPVFESEYTLQSFYPFHGYRQEYLGDSWLVDRKHSRIMLVFSGEGMWLLVAIQVPGVRPWHTPVTATIQRINPGQALDIALEESPVLNFARQLPKNAGNEVELDGQPDGEQAADAADVKKSVCVSAAPGRSPHMIDIALWIEPGGEGRMRTLGLIQTDSLYQCAIGVLK